MEKSVTTYTIAQATLEDVHSIRQIAVYTWWSVYPSIISAEQIEYMLESMFHEDVLKKSIMEEDQVFLVLSEDEIAEAFAAYSVKNVKEDTIKLQKIYILPQKQSKGFGKALISKIVDIALVEGREYLELNVNRENPARFFYEKLGFKVVEEVDIPIGPFWMNDYVMRLDIKNNWRIKI